MLKLIPGHHRRIDNGEGGTSYIDDFEASRASIDIKNVASWASYLFLKDK